jgi:adenosylcobinamide-GDP ribazoletransferase
MRDSRLGTYGATALFVSLALRVALLAPLDLQLFAAADAAGHVLGRAAGVAIAATLPPVGDQGLGAKVIGPAGAATAIGVAATSLAAAFFGGRAWAPALLAVAVLSVVAVRRVARRRIGGLTGDLLGATNQLAHLGVLVVVVALHRAGWR